jgi:hypothetical protein
MRDRRPTCWRCQLARRVAVVLDDGHGRVHPGLVPLADALKAMGKPRTGLGWLESKDVSGRLRALATGEVALTHQGIDTFAASAGREYLRDLLVTHGVLPNRDKYLAAFERWSIGRLEAIEDPGDRQLVRTYLRWHLHRRLRERAETGALHESTTGQARQQASTAVHFLDWLHVRGRTLADCGQADVDDWFAAPPSTRWAARGFLVWAISHRHCPPLEVPYCRGTVAPALSRTQLLATLGRLFGDDTIELGDRAAGLLVLLFAQPVARIRILAVSDLEHHDGLWLRVGAARLPLPEHLATLTTDLVARRRNMDTAANPASPWLFPGYTPGQPIQARELARRLAMIHLTRLGRLGALKQLVAEVPAPVLGELIGYKPRIVAKHAMDQAVDWNAYAALKARDQRT